MQVQVERNPQKAFLTIEKFETGVKCCYVNTTACSINRKMRIQGVAKTFLALVSLRGEGWGAQGG